MNKPLIICGAAATLLFVAGCQTKSDTAMPVTPKAQYAAAIAAAKTAEKAAHAAGNEWRDTGKLIKKAKASASEGDYAAAIKEADMATFQGNAAVAQAKANAGTPSN